MKALVYKGPGEKALENRPKPEITAPTDAIVTITKRLFAAPTCISSRAMYRVVSLAVFWVTKVLALLTRLGQVSPHSSRETEC